MLKPRFLCHSLLGALMVAAAVVATTGAAVASAAPAAGDSSSPTSASPRAEGRSNVLRAGSILRAGDRRTSSDGKYTLQMRRDGNLVVLQARSHAVVWATDTAGRHARAAMQTDGNLVVYGRKKVLWASGTGARGAHLTVQGDGNLVIYKGKRAVWSRYAENQVVYPGHRLRPGVSVVSYSAQSRLIMQTDGNLVMYGPGGTVKWALTTSAPGTTARMTLTGQLEVEGPTGALIWTSASPSSPGARLHVLDDGNLVIVSTGGQVLWSIGTASG